MFSLLISHAFMKDDPVYGVPLITKDIIDNNLVFTRMKNFYKALFDEAASSQTSLAYKKLVQAGVDPNSPPTDQHIKDNCLWTTEFIWENPFNHTTSRHGVKADGGTFSSKEASDFVSDIVDGRQYLVPWLNIDSKYVLKLFSMEFMKDLPCGTDLDFHWLKLFPQSSFSSVSDKTYGTSLCEPTNKSQLTCCMATGTGNFKCAEGVQEMLQEGYGQLKKIRENLRDFLIIESASAWYPRCHSLIKQWACDMCNAHASTYTVFVPSIQRNLKVLSYPYLQTIFCESFVEKLYQECKHVPAFTDYWIVPKGLQLLDFKRMMGIPVSATDYYPNKPGETCFSASFNAGFKFSVSHFLLILLGLVGSFVTIF